MNANAEIIAELRRVLNERDEAREQLDLTKRELGRWVDRETKAVRERDSYQRQLDAIGDAIVTSITKRIEPRISRHPVTVVMAAGSLIAKIGEAIGCEFEDGDDLLEAVKELVRERDEARAELSKLRKDYDSVLEANVGLLDGAPYVDARAAFRRGAEAMREACAQWFREHDESFELTVDACHDVIADMPIPEEP